MNKNILFSVIAAILTAVITVKMVAPKNDNVDLVDAKETSYERVMRTGVLRCGYVVYPPALERDPNTGEIYGIMYEIVELMARKLNWRVEWVIETSFADYSEELKTEKIDAMCSAAWPISARAHHVDFAMPLWYSVVSAWSRINDNRFESDINFINNPNIKISAVDGTIPFYIAKENFPKAEVLSLPPLTDYTFNLVNVSNEKSDVTFVEVYQGNDYLANNPNTLKNITVDNPLVVYSNSVSVKKGEDLLINSINTALSELMHSGFVDRVIDKHEKYPGSFRRVAKPYEISQ